MESRSPDAIIIGAGIIGSCLALEMARRGWQTLTLDKLPTAGYGSTSVSCAIIRTHYSTLTGTAIAYESYHRWRAWGEYIGTADEEELATFRQTGCLVLKTEGNHDLQPVLGHTKSLGIPWEEWDQKKILDHLPFLDLNCFSPPRQPDAPGFGEPSGGQIAGGVYFPFAGYINDPQLSAQNAMMAAKREGAKFRFNAEVTAVDSNHGRVTGVTLTSGEQIKAPVVVNVAGPHSSKINQLAGVDGQMSLSTRALRQEVAYVPFLPTYDDEGTSTIYSDNDVGCYLRSEVGNKVLIGSENPACDPIEWVDPDTMNENLTDQALSQVMRVAQRIPELGIPRHLGGVVACYDVTPDWIPIYDKSDLDGFYLAIGTSGNQFKNAPVVGEMMAEMIAAGEDGVDLDRSPLEFRLRQLDRTIDTGFFSRNRTVNDESSFSVLG
ncbi:MAG: FAD-dependent oxidoreductase [Acidiferrobacteraceae bacterium]|jgi:sarcosine oxidase subunit beta|nr:FAD-dependent oxidoreductase [Acidiferrobacteraceae bacterium]MDP6434633.1 FAD-dependent oxidoreductase [Arenicellales bacterium]MDP6672788.1 FAD-dependent oxidoreductase [Arenicellales bacterium]MDP6724198.1 FAD-dependent oxidoreductase [Arenicellales bacterium]|tara:strand:+ start:1587 stop:2894 length:1308 start_codon:yes stop_codon:yes gene_type:complete